MFIGFTFRQLPFSIAVIILLIFSLMSCQSTPSRDELVFSGFLTDYSNLQPMQGSDTALYYEKESVNWGQYNQIFIEPVPVQVKKSSSDGLSVRDSMMLGSYFQMAMKKAVKRKYLLADEIDINVLVVRVAVNELPGSSMSSGSRVIIEGELVDGNTGEPLVAIVDSKESTLSASFSKWNDVTFAFDQWAEQLYQLLNQHMANRVISEDAKTDITQLIKKANKAFRLTRLTTPVGKSAVDYYHKIIAIEPGNAIALEGLSKVTRQYLRWAEEAFEKGNIQKASLYLENARDISTNDQTLLALEQRINTSSDKNKTILVEKKSEPQSNEIAESIEPEIIEESEIETEIEIIVSEQISVLDESPESSPSIHAVEERVEVETIVQEKDPEISVESVAETLPEAAPVTVASEVTTQAVISKSPTEPVDSPKQNKSTQHRFNGSKLKPYIMASKIAGNKKKVVTAVKQRLTDAGFSIAGEYSPYRRASIIVITNSALKKLAANSPEGGYGAVLRVSVTESGSGIQVAFNNPWYTANIYRLNGSIDQIGNDLVNALSGQFAFGSKTGFTPDELRGWHYMFGMPYFDEPIKLFKAQSHELLVARIEKNLSAHKSGAEKVYRVDIPGKKQTVFGIGITKGWGSDKIIMGNIDVSAKKHSAYLPYEILVDGNTAYMLDAKFRIALSFPDLTMRKFLAINSTPDAIEDIMKTIVRKRGRRD